MVPRAARDRVGSRCGRNGLRPLDDRRGPLRYGPVGVGLAATGIIVASPGHRRTLAIFAAPLCFGWIGILFCASALAALADITLLARAEGLFTLVRPVVDAGEEYLVEIDVGEFVIPIGDTAHSFDASEATFDRVVGTVGGWVERPRHSAIRLRWGDQLPAEFGSQQRLTTIQILIAAAVSCLGELASLTRPVTSASSPLMPL